MQTISNRLYGSAQARFSIDQSIASLTIEGVFSCAVIVRLMQGVEDDLGVTRASALVADYSRVLMKVSARTMLASTNVALGTKSWLRLPTAIVINQDDSEMWRTYCLLQGRRGILRQAFTDPAQAGQWAAEMAAIYESEARRRERGQSR